MDRTPPYGPPVETTVPVWAKVGVPVAGRVESPPGIGGNTSLRTPLLRMYTADP